MTDEPEDKEFILKTSSELRKVINTAIGRFVRNRSDAGERVEEGTAISIITGALTGCIRDCCDLYHVSYSEMMHTYAEVAATGKSRSAAFHTLDRPENPNRTQ